MSTPNSDKCIWIWKVEDEKLEIKMILSSHFTFFSSWYLTSKEAILSYEEKL